jgi:hypothetical protein
MVLNKFKIIKKILFLTMVRRGIVIVFILSIPFQLFVSWLTDLPLLFSLFSHFIVWYFLIEFKIKPEREEIDEDNRVISDMIKELKLELKK